MSDQQPGEIIAPIPHDDVPMPPVQPQPIPAQPVQVMPPQQPTPAIQPDPTPVQQIPVPAEPTFYTETNAAPDPLSQNISWQAAEFISHDKNSTWYGAMVLGAIIFAAIVYFLNRDILTSVIVLLALVGLAYFSGKKPREQQFSVSADGIQVGRNYYPFHDFHSFSIIEEPSSTSVVLAPLKRFLPAVNVYIPKDYEESVINLIANILPFEQPKTDIVDSIMRRIRF